MMIFIDIGNRSISLDHVTSIYRAPNAELVIIDFDVLDGDGPATLSLYDDNAIVFKEWWARHRKISELTIVGL